MLRKLVSQIALKNRPSAAYFSPANVQRHFSSYGFDDDDEMDTQEGDESYNNLLYDERKDSMPRRQTMPKAAKKNRYMAVKPEDKGRLRRHLLNEFKKQHISVGEPVIEGQILPPDVHLLQDQLELDEDADDMEFDQDTQVASFNLERLGYLRQIVHMDQVQKVMPLENRLSFRAMVVVGNRRGAAGYAMGKGASVPDAIERATMTAINRFTYVDRFDNRTLYHQVDGKWNSCTLFIRPCECLRIVQRRLSIH